MKVKITLYLLFIAPALSTYANDCELAYQQASYSLEHAEKAMASNNIEHLKLYARRASEALQNAYSFSRKCDCQNASDAAYEGLADLKKTIGYETFEKARYYAKEGLNRSRDMLKALDICSEANAVYTMDSSTDNLAMQQQLLLEQQQRLEEQQRKLEEQLRAQEALKERIRKEKAARLALQLELKNEAEDQLVDLEKLFNNLVETMGCEDGLPIGLGDYTRSQDELKAETLSATRHFYSGKVQELTNALLIRLSNCSLE